MTFGKFDSSKIGFLAPFIVLVVHSLPDIVMKHSMVSGAMVALQCVHSMIVSSNPASMEKIGP